MSISDHKRPYKTTLSHTSAKSDWDTNVHGSEKQQDHMRPHKAMLDKAIQGKHSNAR